MWELVLSGRHISPDWSPHSGDSMFTCLVCELLRFVPLGLAGICGTLCLQGRLVLIRLVDMRAVAIRCSLVFCVNCCGSCL